MLLHNEQETKSVKPKAAAEAQRMTMLKTMNSKLKWNKPVKW